MSTVFALLRHQTSSMVATVVDFSVMITLVTFGGVNPAAATAGSAALGGIVNFVLGRFWVFHATHHRTAPQAARYALVSFGSLLLNTAGEHVLAERLHVQYVAARVVVSFVVSIFWNFPMQRTFVFRAAS